MGRGIRLPLLSQTRLLLKARGNGSQGFSSSAVLQADAKANAEFSKDIAAWHNANFNERYVFKYSPSFVL